MASKKKDKGDQPSIWSSILAEARHAATLPDSLLLVLGRSGIGKRTFLQALQHHAVGSGFDKEDVVSHSRAVALDYAYVNVRDPEHDTDGNPEARCSVLMLEDMHYENLVVSRLQGSELKNYLALICLDMKEPWTIMKDLNNYLEFLQRLTSKLLGDLPLEEQDALRQKIEARIRKAQDKDNKGGTDKADKKEDEKKDEKKEDAKGESDKDNGANPLAPGVLTYNLGIPVIVCVLRSDTGQSLESRQCAGWHEAILCHLRSACLSYGAALTYLMAQGKTPVNIECTYDWIVHCLYNYPFNHPLNLEAKDSIFLPSGGDSQKAIQDAAKAIPGGSLEQPFETIVTPPTKAQRSAAPVDEVEVEDMNAFLKRAKQQLKTGVSSGGPASKLLMGATGPNTKQVQQNLPSGGSGDGVAKSTSPVGSPSDNSSLANFFQDLLTRGQSGAKKTGMAVPPSGKGAAMALAAKVATSNATGGSKDAATRAARLEQTQDLKKELERLKQQSKAKLENVKRTSVAGVAEEKKEQI